jgi:nucleoside-diphosphate-sugar epimerase
MSGMRVMVTGASGFIGRHCVPALLERGCKVHAVSRGPAAWEAPGLIWHQADILQPASIAQVFAECQPTHLIHSAWNIAPDHWISADNLTWAARSMDLLHEAQRCGIRRVVGIGTCAEYGPDHDLCDERSTPMRPVGVYAQAKHATQILFDAAVEALGLSTAWARLFFPYGPFDRPTKLIPYTIRQLLKGEPAELSSGQQVRDPIFASDVGGAIVAVLFSDVTGPVNIASGIGMAVRELVLRVGELMGRPGLIRLGARPTPSLEALSWVASVKRLNREVGWRAITPLEEGLRTTIAAYRKAGA